MAAVFGRIQIGQWLVYSAELIGTKSLTASQDSSLVTQRQDGTIRVAAIDGVTPVRDTPSRVGLDGAIWGAAMVRTALLATDEALTCLRRANLCLHDPRLPARFQAQATVAVADLSPSGQLTCLRGCDAEIAVCDRSGTWSLLFPPAARPWAVLAWADHLAQHPELRLDAAARHRAEQLVWGQPAAWTSHPVGRHAMPIFEIAKLGPDDWTSLLLATDGLGLRKAASIERLALRLRRSMVSDQAPYDDTTALLIERAAV